MAQDKHPLAARAFADPGNDTADLSQELTRIVQFLDSKRAVASERSAGLAQDLASNREAAYAPRSSVGDRDHDDVVREAGLGQNTVLDQASASRSVAASNRELAVRYRTFCRELDDLLDTFRARVGRSKPVQH